MIRTACVAFLLGGLIAAATLPRAPASPTDCERALAELDRKIAFHEKRAARSGWWIDREEIALAHLARAHLTGHVRDLVNAERALELAFASAEPNSGPFLARAQLSFALHRFDRVEADLAASSSFDPRSIAELRADLLLHQGRYREAERAYLALLAAKRTPTALARLANYRWKTDELIEAEALMSEALSRAPRKGELAAWLEVLRGQMSLSRARWAEAHQRFIAADRAFSGWFLVQENLAKALIGMGEEERARDILQHLAERGSAEHVHALAELLESRGEFAHAAELHAQAKALFAEQITIYPEAFSAHALGHLLAHGEPGVEIARANHRLRPNAESLVLLAQAHLGEGEIEEAVRAVQSALATPISTPELHATAAHVFEAAQMPGAEQQKQRAASLDPAAYESLLWLRRGAHAAEAREPRLRRSASGDLPPKS
jgi:FimV-like protein